MYLKPPNGEVDFSVYAAALVFHFQTVLDLKSTLREFCVKSVLKQILSTRRQHEQQHQF